MTTPPPDKRLDALEKKIKELTRILRINTFWWLVAVVGWALAIGLLADRLYGAR